MKEVYNPFSLKGKTVLITGASSGIGRATAITCSKMGAKVIITGRNQERLEETKALIKGEDVQLISCDLSFTEELNELIEFIPKLDGIVLAAGIVEMYPIQFVTQKRLQKIFQTNFFSPIELLRLVVKRKKYIKGLSVVIIDSIAGNEDIVVGNSIYGSSKAALKSFMKFFSLEMIGKGIRMNSISPGLILTPMQTHGVVTEQDLDKAIEKVPMKRWGTPEDISPAIVFLLSDASSYMTASDIKIDGGYTI